MSIIWSAIETDGFIINGATDTATGADTSIVRGGVSVALSQTAYSPVFPGVVDCWHHFEFYQNANQSNPTNGALYNLVSNTGQVLARIVINTTSLPNNCSIQYWNGAAFVTGYTWNSQGVRIEFDVRIKCGSFGRAEIYANRNLQIAADVDYSAYSSIVQVQYLYGTNASMSFINYQNIVADEPTVGWKAYRNPLVANGANTAWTGAVTDINEATLNDATFLTTSTATDKRTFTQTTPPTLPQGIVKALVTTARVRSSDGLSPNKVRTIKRRGGTNYFSATFTPIGVGFQPMIISFDTDPSTGLAWTSANAINTSNETGVEAVA